MVLLNLTIAALCACCAAFEFGSAHNGIAIAYLGFGCGYAGLALSYGAA